MIGLRHSGSDDKRIGHGGENNRTIFYPVHGSLSAGCGYGNNDIHILVDKFIQDRIDCGQITVCVLKLDDAVLSPLVSYSLHLFDEAVPCDVQKTVVTDLKKPDLVDFRGTRQAGADDLQSKDNNDNGENHGKRTDQHLPCPA